jgi:hypothetical protein
MEHSSGRNCADLVILKQAQRWHQQWKEKLLAAVLARESIDVETISRDNCCELGKWIYSDEQRRYWSAPAFRDLVLHHREFHMLNGAVAEIINARKYDLAKTYLTNNEQLAKSSYELDKAILCLKNLVSGRSVT